MISVTHVYIELFSKCLLNIIFQRNFLCCRRHQYPYQMQFLLGYFFNDIPCANSVMFDKPNSIEVYHHKKRVLLPKCILCIQFMITAMKLELII